MSFDAARLLVALALLAATAGTAGAAPEEAELIRRGVAAREQSRDLEAYEIFGEAWQRFRTPRAQAQLGLAAQALGRWVEAETNLRGALAATSDPWIAANRGVLERALATVEDRLGSLEVLVNVPGAAVSVDGTPAGTVPLAAPVRLPEGTAVVRVEAAGHVPLQRTVHILARQTVRESFHLTPLERPALPPAPVADPRPELTRAPPAGDSPPRTWRRAGLIAGVAATALVAGLATWSGLDTLAARDRYVADPTRDRYHDGRGRERRTDWLLGGAVVLGVSTAVFGIVTAGP